MAENDDLFVAQAALAQGLVTREQLRECLFQVALDRKLRPAHPRPLGPVLVSRGYLKDEQLLAILSSRLPPPDAGAPPEVELGKLLVLSGACSTAQVAEGLKAQKELEAAGTPRRLGEILVEKGMVTPEQVRRALAYHNKAVYVCGACKTRFNIINAKPTGQYACKKCGGPLHAASRDSVHADESDILPRPPSSELRMSPAPPAEAPTERSLVQQAMLDRAMAAYLRQKGVAAEAIDESRRQQIEFMRFGIVASMAEILYRTGVVTPEQYREVSKAVASPAWALQPIPGYAITGILAQGAFSSLMVAQPVFAEGSAGIKMLHGDFAADPAAVERFTNEASLFMRLDHAGLVKGHEFGRTVAAGDTPAEVPYLVTEYVRGETLAHMLETRGRQSPAVAMRVAHELAQALEYLHNEGISHQDVRPESLLLDARTHVKICDLAHAKPAPWDGEDARKDVYCIGLTLLSMLSGGTLDLAAETPSSTLASMAEVPDVSGVRAPPHVMGLLQRFFDPDPGKRLSTVRAVIEGLEGR